MRAGFLHRSRLMTRHTDSPMHPHPQLHRRLYSRLHRPLRLSPRYTDSPQRRLSPRYTDSLQRRLSPRYTDNLRRQDISTRDSPLYRRLSSPRYRDSRPSPEADITDRLYRAIIPCIIWVLLCRSPGAAICSQQREQGNIGKG